MPFIFESHLRIVKKYSEVFQCTYLVVKVCVPLTTVFKAAYLCYLSLLMLLGNFRQSFGPIVVY